MPSHILLLESPSAFTLCGRSRECTDMSYCDKEQPVQQEWVSNSWASCMGCHIFFVRAVLPWNSDRQCILLGVIWLMVCLTQQRGPSHNNGHSMTWRITITAGYRTWEPLRTLGLFSWFCGICRLFFTNGKLTSITSVQIDLSLPISQVRVLR